MYIRVAAKEFVGVFEWYAILAGFKYVHKRLNTTGLVD